jgi:hypothetical protein
VDILQLQALSSLLAVEYAATQLNYPLPCLKHFGENHIENTPLPLL